MFIVFQVDVKMREKGNFDHGFNLLILLLVHSLYDSENVTVIIE